MDIGLVFLIMFGLFAFFDDPKYIQPDANIHKQHRIIIPKGMNVRVNTRTGDVTIIKGTKTQTNEE